MFLAGFQVSAIFRKLKELRFAALRFLYFGHRQTVDFLVRLSVITGIIPPDPLPGNLLQIRIPWNSGDIVRCSCPAGYHNGRRIDLEPPTHSFTSLFDPKPGRTL